MTVATGRMCEPICLRKLPCTCNLEWRVYYALLINPNPRFINTALVFNVPLSFSFDSSWYEPHPREEELKVKRRHELHFQTRSLGSQALASNMVYTSIVQPSNENDLTVL